MDAEISFLKQKGVGSGIVWIYRDDRPLSAEALGFNEMVHLDTPVDLTKPPARFWSSWDRCALAGLIEVGWFGQQRDPINKPSPQFWGIRLTPKGRDALSGTTQEQNVPLSEVGADQNRPPEGKGQ